jgi:hypothetical protein
MIKAVTTAMATSESRVPSPEAAKRRFMFMSITVKVAKRSFAPPPPGRGLGGGNDRGEQTFIFWGAPHLAQIGVGSPHDRWVEAFFALIGVYLRTLSINNQSSW